MRGFHSFFNLSGRLISSSREGLVDLRKIPGGGKFHIKAAFDPDGKMQVSVDGDPIDVHSPKPDDAAADLDVIVTGSAERTRVVAELLAGGVGAGLVPGERHVAART